MVRDVLEKVSLLIQPLVRNALTIVNRYEAKFNKELHPLVVRNFRLLDSVAARDHIRDHIRDRIQDRIQDQVLPPVQALHLGFES